MESASVVPLYQIFGIGLSGYDVALLIICPLCGMVGTMVSDSVKGILNKPEFKPLTELPSDIRTKIEQSSSSGDEDARFLADFNRRMEIQHRQYIRRLEFLDSFRLPFIGLALGFVVALYFLGAITNDLTSLSRVLGLCILLGYQAPNIWFTQEQTIKRALNKKIDLIINEAGLKGSEKFGK